MARQPKSRWWCRSDCCCLLIGVAQTRWDPGVARVLPEFFAGNQVAVLGVNITYHQLTVIATAIAVVVGLRLFLYRTRAGIALRAVVDAPDVAALNGAAPDRVSQMGWVIGAMLASLAGVLCWRRCWVRSTSSCSRSS